MPRTAEHAQAGRSVNPPDWPTRPRAINTGIGPACKEDQRRVVAVPALSATLPPPSDSEPEMGRARGAACCSLRVPSAGPPAVRSGRWRGWCLPERGSRAMPLIHVALTVSDPAPSAAFNGEYSGRTERLDEDDHRLILGSATGPSSRSRKGSRSPEGFLARTTSASAWRTRLPSAPRATASGQRALSRRSGRTTGVSCTFEWPTPTAAASRSTLTSGKMSRSAGRLRSPGERPRQARPTTT